MHSRFSETSLTAAKALCGVETFLIFIIAYAKHTVNDFVIFYNIVSSNKASARYPPQNMSINIRYAFPNFIKTPLKQTVLGTRKTIYILPQ